MSVISSQFTIKEQLDGVVDITNDYLQIWHSLGIFDEDGSGDVSQMAEGLNYKDTTFAELDKDLQEQWFKENEDAYEEYYSKHKEDKDANGNVLTEEQIKANFIESMGQITVSAADVMRFDFTQTQQEKEEEARKIKQQLEANGITGDNLELVTNYDNETGKRLVEQTNKMGAEAGNNYIAAFNKAVQGSKDKTAMANYLSSIDPTNMTEVVKAMDYMQSQGIDSSKIQEFWDTITNGAGTYISSLNEILQLTERIQKKMTSVTDVSKRMEEGTGTYEDVMALVNAGADISKFQLTPEGWKATGEDIEEATQKLKEYNAEQARAVAAQQQEQLNKVRNNIWDGIIQNSDGSFKISKTGGYLSEITTVNSETGKLVGGTVTKDNAEFVKKGLESFGENINREDYQTDEEYLAAIQSAYDSYISLLNNMEQIQIVANKTAAMAEAARYTADENAARGGSDESVRYSMETEAKEAGLDPSEVKIMPTN